VEYRLQLIDTFLHMVKYLKLFPLSKFPAYLYCVYCSKLYTLVFKEEIAGAYSAAGQNAYFERCVLALIHFTESCGAGTDRVYPAGYSLFHRRVDLVALSVSVDSRVLHRRYITSHYMRAEYKKLSYCCDSRSYCVQEYDRLKQLLRDIYFIAIHCDRSVSTCE